MFHRIGTGLRRAAAFACLVATAGLAPGAFFQTGPVLSEGLDSRGVVSNLVLGRDRVAVHQNTSGNPRILVYARVGGAWMSYGTIATTEQPRAIDGDTLVAGDWVYVRSGSGWVRQFNIGIGYAQARLQGDTLVVSDPFDGTVGTIDTADGAVYVFTRSGTTWTQQAKLVPDTPRNERMGTHLALDGDMVVATGIEDPSDRPGEVMGAYVFRRSGPSWTQVARLTPAVAGERFGVAAVGGNVIALRTGNAVTAYRRFGSTVNFEQRLEPNITPSPDWPISLAIMDGSIVAARGSSVYGFVHTGAQWTLAQQLDPFSQAGGDLIAHWTSVFAGPTGSEFIPAIQVGGLAPLVDGMRALDVGTATQGSSTGSVGNYTVRGAGSDIWGTGDQFHFLSRSLEGNVTLVVHVASLQNTNGWAKGGIMLRENLSPGARNVMVLSRPDKTVAFQWRNTTGGPTTNIMGTYNLAEAWLMLTRNGDTFDAYESPDGDNWRKIGSVTIPGLPAHLLGGMAVTSHAGATLAAAEMNEFDFLGTTRPREEPSPLPTADWAGTDLGAVGVAGSHTMSADRTAFSLTGSGTDIWGTNDSGRHVSIGWSGNGEIIARVTGLQNTHGWAKAGVMFRTVANSSSPYAFVLLTPNGVASFQSRDAVGAEAQMTSQVWGYGAPSWVRLVRSGDLFTAYVSANGINWTSLGSRELPLGSHITAGLAVTSHDNSRTTTATFDNVLVRDPFPAPSLLTATQNLADRIELTWQDRAFDETGYEVYRSATTSGFTLLATLPANAASYADTGLAADSRYYYRVRALRGAVASAYTNTVEGRTLATAPAPTYAQARIGAAINGAMTVSGGQISLSSTSADIWGTADAAEYAYRSVTGDFRLEARVDSLGNTHGWAKAGVMFRESLAAGSPHAFICVTPSSGVAFQFRETANGQSAESGRVWGAAAPYWIRLVRQGNTFTSYASVNGTTWQQVGTRTIPMGASMLVGFAVTSHNNSASTTAVFSNIGAAP